MNRDDVLSIVRQFTGHENIIAVPRILIELTGDPILAMMLNQLLYWSAQKEWIYKSLEDWNEEIGGISRYRMDKFAELPYVETELHKANGAPTTHYRINADLFYDALMKIIEAKSICGNQQIYRTAEISNSLTKTTTEITHKDPTATVSETEKQNSDVAEVFKAYESEIGMITSFVREEVLDAIEHYPHDWIIEAIKEAAKNNVRKWSYARAILESWKVNGYKTDVRPKEKVSSNSKKVKHEDNEERVNNFRKLYKERNNVPQN